MTAKEIEAAIALLRANNYFVCTEEEKEHYFHTSEIDKFENDTTINLDDANYDFKWAAQDGDVVFWKIPVDMEVKHGERIKDAFRMGCFGEEWGGLSSHSVRTLDLETLNEIDDYAHGDYDEDDL